jgi:hypothetical protein
MNISEINNSFKNGYIPDSLYWNIEKDRIQIDPRKISYTDYYQSYDFYESKFEGDYSTIPGFDKVIENMAEMSIKKNNTPLKEINERLIFDENNNKISSDR